MQEDQQILGVTLTCANTMFVLDPILRPSRLRQLLGRMYRCGQRQEQHVYFMSLAGSINELLNARCEGKECACCVDHKAFNPQKGLASAMSETPAFWNLICCLQSMPHTLPLKLPKRKQICHPSPQYM
jgi:hypothetical protein